jgi:Tol biopolymer transport system component
MRRLLLILAICSAVAFAPVPARKTHRILYACDRSGNFEIMSVDANGKNERYLTNNDAKDTSPSLSQDGKKIAFVSDRDGISEIYVMDANGKNVRRLTREGHPAFRRNGLPTVNRSPFAGR